MVLSEVYGGSNTSDRNLRGGLVQHRTTSIVPPERRDSPKDFASLLQKRRATGLTTSDTGKSYSNGAAEIIPLPLTKATDAQTIFTTERDENTRSRRKRRRKEKRINEIILATNPTMDTLLQKIQQTPPDWEYLTTRIAELPVSRQAISLHGPLAELYVSEMLDTFAESDSLRDVIKVVNLDGERTNKYNFKKTRGGLYAVSNKTHDEVAEYDGLIEVDSIPTVIEVKAKTSKRDGTDSFNDAMRDKRIIELFTPLQQLYGPDTYFGYIIITTPELISQTSSLQRNFQDEGGHLIAMDTTLEELKEQASRVVFPRNIPVYSTYS